MALKKETVEALKKTNSNSIAGALFKKGFRNICIQGVDRVNPSDRVMVGQAYTLRFIPGREDVANLASFSVPRHPQMVCVEEIKEGEVLVIDAQQDMKSGAAGDLMLTRMEKRGVEGVVCDGGLRDGENLRKLRMPSFRGASAPSLTISGLHAVDVQVPIGCGGVAVYPGDVIVGDNDGVVVIPIDLADEVAETAVEGDKFEDFILWNVNQGNSLDGIYPPDANGHELFNKWCAENGR